ncbi:MAG: hypothetical protein R3C42_05205 [Parvularculaceae bacterium]
MELEITQTMFNAHGHISALDERALFYAAGANWRRARSNNEAFVGATFDEVAHPGIEQAFRIASPNGWRL